MKFETTRFGCLEVKEEEVTFFPEGIPGFVDYRRYVFLAGPDNTPFRWLQSAERPELAFVVTDPRYFFPDYRVRVAPEMIEVIEPEAGENVMEVLVILLIPPDDPRQITANLQAPLIINKKRQLGMQLVLPDEGYGMKHRIFPVDEQREAVGGTICWY